MNIVLPSAGKYVVAVSGGVDSMTLLHLLCQRADLELVVAHFDHGIRPDSADDKRLVQSTANNYDLPFMSEEGNLGLKASEAAARAARYDFLRRVQSTQHAAAIITAHHQDDLLETAILNMLRGTGRKGLTALTSRPDLIRPLLNVPKSEILAYSYGHGLVWREDITNQDTGYTRNYVRHKLLSRFKPEDKAKLADIITKLQTTNQQLDEELINQLHVQPEAGRISRRWFNQLPHAVAKEAMATWLRSFDVRDFDRKGLERLVVSVKTAPTGKIFDVLGGKVIEVKKDYLALA